MKRITRSIVAAAALLAPVAFAAPAQGQLEHLNVDRLIKELRERGMSDLLIRLSKDGSIKDKADAGRIIAEMSIMRAQTPVPDNPRDLEERIASMEEGVAQFNALIAAHREHTKRPLWQADLALHLIYTRMTLNKLADDFYEFGVPTKEQAEVFESGAAMATENLIDGSTFLNKLQRDLPRASDYNQAYVNTGRWEEMMDEYLKTKVPFLLGQAAYAAALLPDSHPYFANLGKNPNIPLQAPNAAAERKRLLEMAVDALSNIPPALGEKFGLPARPTNLIKGKALTRLGKFDEAIALLDAVANESKDDLIAIRALLTKAIALELKNKTPQQSLDLLETLKDHAMAQGGSVAFPIIIADLQHRLLLKHAGTEKAKLEAAYKPYESLFADKRLGDNIDTARMFVFERWTKLYADQKQADLPPMVLSGMGEMERIKGNDLVNIWYDELKKDNKPAAEKAINDAREHLNRCIAVADTLIGRADVPPEVKARARYNKAYASFLHDPENTTSFITAAGIWTELANELPTHPLAEEAIGLAVRFLHNLHIQSPRPAGVDAAYRNTTAVLFSKLPDSKVAEDERSYYTFNVLQADGKFKDAAASYEKIPPQHKDYVEAQREWLYSQIQLWRALPEADKAAKRDVLREEIGRIETVARKEMKDEGDASRRQMFKTTLGDLMLTKVELDMHRKAWDEADRVLRGFADAYPGEADLIRLAMSRRIMVKVKQNDPVEAVKLAEALMKEAGNDPARQAGAAGTIDSALAELGDEIEDLRAAAEVTAGNLAREELLKKATEQAGAADKLADMLLEWATEHKIEEEQIFRYRMIKVRSSILTGKRAEAAAALEPLAKAFPGEPRIVFLQAEVLYMNPADQRLAIDLFIKLTKQFTPQRLTPQMAELERNNQDVVNRIWWQSWLRVLQIYEKLPDKDGKLKQQIPRIVAQLELQYPDLGGPSTRSKFQQLAARNRK